MSNCSFTGYFLCPYGSPGITSSFFVDFHGLLENLITIHPEFSILGDFNLQLDTQSTATSTFNDILGTFDLKQHVSFSTHIHGLRLDLFVTRSTPDYIHPLTVTDSLSGHFTLRAGIKFKHKPVDSKCSILYRYTHDIDILAFNDDIMKSELITIPNTDLSQLCEQYHITL